MAKRWILVVLRRRTRTSCSLEELNKAIPECLEQLNTRTLRRLDKFQITYNKFRTFAEEETS
ncbi:hypothetical protein [Acetomicrobium mobile]|uniref:hypothetical protein n=1 Tax=Acetomicrobium mobile TaxID=97477 RepID=UPI00350E527A